MSKATPLLFLALILVCSAGLYGCTQQKNAAASAKLHDLETRFAKLEEDYRAVSSSNDAQRKKLHQAQSEKAELAKEVEDLRPVVQDRDELRKQLVTRTGERDNVQAQLVQFRQDLQSLVSRVDTALNSPGGAPSVPAAPLTVLPASRKSE